MVFGFGEEKQYAAIEEINQAIAPEQLAVLRNQLDSEQPNPSPQSEFNYGWALLKSVHHRQQQQGIEILAHLYRDVPELRRDSLYYLALGSYKVGEYANARRYTEQLLEKEPQNTQFQSLRDAIESKITQEGIIGIGIAGGILAVGVGIIGALVRKKR